MLPEIDDAGINLQFVIHAAAVEEEAAIGEQEQVSIEREARKSIVEVEQLPGVGCGVVDFDRIVVRICRVLGESGGGKSASIAQSDEAGIPAAMCHGFDEGPRLRGGIEYSCVVAPLKRVVMPSATGRKQTTVGQQGVTAAEEIKRAMIWCEQCGGGEENVWGGGRLVPPHAGEKAIRPSAGNSR